MSRTIVAETNKDVKLAVGGPPISAKGEVSNVEEQRTRELRGGRGEVVGSAVKHDPEAAERPKRYRVVKEKSYMHNHMKFTLHEGKIVDEHNYSIRDLRAQGVKLVEIDEDDEEVKRS